MTPIGLGCECDLTPRLSQPHSWRQNSGLSDGLLVKGNAVTRNKPDILCFNQLESISGSAGEIEGAKVNPLFILCVDIERNVEHVHLGDGSIFRLLFDH